MGTAKNETIRLVLSREDAINPQARYITLSYRWGTEPQKVVLKTSNISSFRRGYLIHNLPQTFRDLILVTRAFEIRYVWIDALCIIQDSAEDWEREGATMRDVYAHSACTIAATASENPDQGLFRHRDPAIIMPGRIRAPDGTSALSSTPQADDNTKAEAEKYLLFDRGFLERRIFHGPLHTRGWVFQERMLSPRVLHFARDQLVWECFAETKCEAFPDGMPLDIRTKDLYAPLQPPKQLKKSRRKWLSRLLPGRSLGERQEGMDWKTLSTWRELVKQYSKCELTYVKDKLPAFAGIAKAYQDATGDEYLAGLWRSYFLHQLSWRVYTPSGRMSIEYGAPSWSWASVAGAVQPFAMDPQSLFIPVVHDVRVETKGPAYFGRVSTAHLDLEGPLVCADIRGMDSEERTACQLELEGHMIQGRFWTDSVEASFIVGSRVECLPLKVDVVARGADGSPKDVMLTCMVVERVPDSTTPCHYQRVGLLVVSVVDHFLAPIRWFGISITESSTLEVTRDCSLIRIT